MGWLGRTRRWVRRLLGALGVGLCVQIGLGFTSLPYRMRMWLEGDTGLPDEPPTHIVVLGGGEMPSRTALLRTYWGARFAERYPEARILVALPVDGPPGTSSVEGMRDELVLRGVAADRIDLETRGRSTREQAVEALALLGPEARVLLVSSAEHLRRARAAFLKTGFADVHAAPAVESQREARMRFDPPPPPDPSAPRPTPFPTDLGNHLTFRYAFWNQQIYLLESLRELTALAWYRLRGWA